MPRVMRDLMVVPLHGFTPSFLFWLEAVPCSSTIANEG
jgi:hypothetical protein